MDELDIVVHADGSLVVLTLSGEIDLANCDVLRACLESIEDGHERIVVDLAAVPFIDSSGMNVLFAMATAHAAAGRQLLLRRPTERVARVLEIGGITELIPVIDGC